MYNEAEWWQKRMQFLCNTLLFRGSQSHITRYRVSNTLLAILWLHEQLMSWLFFMPYAHSRGEGQSLCLHAGQTYLPSSSWSFWQGQIQLLIALPFCQRRVSRTIWEFLLSSIRVFPLQPVSPPLQKKCQHRIQHDFQISVGRVSKQIITSDGKFGLSGKWGWRGWKSPSLASVRPWFSKHTECCWH